MDILIALVGGAGRVIAKDELIGLVWPDTFVGEANLRVHISTVRRALGDGQAGARYIVNTAGRGYSFVAPTSPVEEADIFGLESPDPGLGCALPVRLNRIIGRDDAIAAIAEQLSQRRLVTIVGPGGIGKTTVALAIAERLGENYANGVCLVDLSQLASPGSIASAVASALGTPLSSGTPVATLITLLRCQNVLLLIDTCEHLIEACATLVEALLKGAPAVSVLATSREPLRAEGEHVYRLPSLATPLPPTGATASEALAFPSVQLFAERVASKLDTFELQDAEAPIVGEICRRLDGIPLAIEMAAAYVDVFGIRCLAQRLDHAFLLLTQGRRTSLPRHQTLRATFDWSYELLPAGEQATLRRLAVLSGSFTLQAAIAIAGEREANDADLIANLANLVRKSLVSGDINGSSAWYRLLDTTRAYAHAKLIASGAFEDTSRRHAEYFLSFFSQAEADLKTTAAAEWCARYGRQLDNVRSALDWAFSPDGDQVLGVALTIAALPLWLHLLLNEECRARIEAALASLHTSGHESRQAMQLLAALGNTLLYTKGARSQASKVWGSTLEIAETIQDIDYQLRALRGLWADALNGGDIRSANRFAEKFSKVAAVSANATDVLIANRLMAQVLYFRGDLRTARLRYEHMLGRYPTDATSLDAIRFQFDQRLIAHADFSRILWIQGYPDQAMRMIESTIDKARAAGNTISMNYALAHAACPIALYVGDLQAAERYLTQLEETSRGPLRPWNLWAHCWKAVLLSRRGDATGVDMLASTLDVIPENGFHMRYTSFLRHLAEAWARLGEFTKASAAIDRALDISDRQDEHWADAELLRVKGDLALRGASENVTMAEDYFKRAIDRAAVQGALSWELRATISLAKLLIARQQVREAKLLLKPVFGKFTEGFDTVDLIKAKELLDLSA